MLTIGTILRNRYRILQVLGSGGFGDTYLAEDQDLPGHPTCVVKQLRPKDNNPEVFRIAKGLFEREAEYLYKIGNAHPEIPTLFAHFTEGGEFYLVQEFVEGHSLATEIPPGRRLTEGETVRLLLDILQVLAFVHQQNVIHRDLKLSNLLRRKKDGKVVLIDFGAVKDVSALQSTPQGATNMTVSIGSPGYMPSEQAQGKPKLSSDVYAVGMIGIQALTGIYPAELPEDVNTGEILWQNLVQISPAFQRILEKMTHYHFGQRYRSAIEALDDLQKLVHSSSSLPTQLLASPPPDSPVAVTNNSPPPTAAVSPPAPRPPLIPILIALAGVLSAGGIWFAVSRPQTIVSSPTETLTPTPTPTPTETPIDTPTVSPSPNQPNSRFIKVKIDELVTYKHPKGIYSISVPKGWNLTDSSQTGIIIQLWLDSAENALLGVQVFEDTGAEASAVLVDFVNRAFSSFSNFQAEKPVTEANGRIRVSWSYDDKIQGIDAKLRGDSYILKYPNRMVFLTVASLDDQFGELKKDFDQILQSFDLNASVALP